MAAFNHRGRREHFRLDYFPSLQTGAFRLSAFSQLLPNFCLSLTRIFYLYTFSCFPPSQLILTLHPPTLEPGKCLSLHLRRRWAFPRRYLPLVWLSVVYEPRISPSASMEWCGLLPKCAADSGSSGTWWLAGGGVTLLILPLGLMSAKSNLNQPQHFKPKLTQHFEKWINKQNVFRNIKMGHELRNLPLPLAWHARWNISKWAWIYLTCPSGKEFVENISRVYISGKNSHSDGTVSNHLLLCYSSSIAAAWGEVTSCSFYSFSTCGAFKGEASSSCFLALSQSGSWLVMKTENWMDQNLCSHNE